MFLRSKPDPESDEQLISAFRATGNLNLVGTLFSRYTPMLYGVCLKYLKDRDDAKDITMQLFEKLGDKLRNHDIANFRSWLYVTARNECLMHIRSKKGKFMKELNQFRLLDSVSLPYSDFDPSATTLVSKA